MTDDVRFAHLDTPLGPMLLAATSRGVAALSRSDDAVPFLASLARRFPDAEIAADDGAVRLHAEWLRGYLDGERRTLAPVDLGGIRHWDRRVYDAVRAIAYGETATYGDVAAAIGAPRAARAVGGALSRCPLFPAVPCHRVVLAGDGFSGWGGGDIALKRRLLRMEAGD